MFQYEENNSGLPSFNYKADTTSIFMIANKAFISLLLLSKYAPTLSVANCCFNGFVSVLFCLYLVTNVEGRFLSK